MINQNFPYNLKKTVDFLEFLSVFYLLIDSFNINKNIEYFYISSYYKFKS